MNATGGASAPTSESIRSALSALALAPAEAAAWAALGGAFGESGQPKEAHTAFGEAARLAPGDLGLALALARAALAAGCAQDELARLEGKQPGDAGSHLARAHLLGRLGRDTEAVGAAAAAVAAAPDAPEPAAEYGLLLFARRDQGAPAALERALALEPGNDAVRDALAVALIRANRSGAAARMIAQTIARSGSTTARLLDLALARLGLGMQAEARALAEQACAQDPANPIAARLLCIVLAYAGGVSGAALSAALRRCGTLWPRREAGPFSNPRDPARRVKLGLLGGAFWRHPVAWLTIAGLEQLDRAGFEILCFAASGPADAFTRRFRAIASSWQEVDRLDDLALARLIRAEGVDILIDLGGYITFGRLPVLAHRPAPVQIKWVGAQFHTTGLGEVDWLITDRFETPPELAPLYGERLLVMPDSYVCYSPPEDAPEIVVPPAQSRGYVTFGSFNTLMKLTPAVIATWATLLRRIGDARLVIKAPQLDEADVAERLVASFGAQGIDRTRIAIRGASGHRELLEEYNDIDLCLQPFPYCGGVTILEALWMGVPSIAVAGESFASRHALSHLAQVGLSDFVAASPAEYVPLAAAKAADLAELSALRASLRGRLRASPLCNASRFGHHLGAALRLAWMEWCSES